MGTLVLHLIGAFISMALAGERVFIYPGVQHQDEHHVKLAKGMVHHHGTGYREGLVWRANAGQHPEGHISFGPYSGLSENGAHLITFRLMAPHLSNGSLNKVIARIDVYDAKSSTLLASDSLYGRDFAGAGMFQDFLLRFKNWSYEQLEFRVYWTGVETLEHQLTVVTRHELEDNFFTGMYDWDSDDLDLQRQYFVGMDFILDYLIDLPSYQNRLSHIKGLTKLKSALPLQMLETLQDPGDHSAHVRKDPRHVSAQEFDDFYRNSRDKLAGIQPGDNETVRFFKLAALNEALKDVSMIYISDEPTLVGQKQGYKGFTPGQAEQAIRACNKYFPGIPTFIAYFSSHASSPRGLTYRGIEFYDHDYLDRNGLRRNKIYDKINEAGKRLGKAKFIGIPRTFEGTGNCCQAVSDDYISRVSQELLPLFKNDFNFVGYLAFTWRSNGNGRSLEDLPKSLQTYGDFNHKVRYQ